jgi:hypothetical protein
MASRTTSGGTVATTRRKKARLVGSPRASASAAAWISSVTPWVSPGPAFLTPNGLNLKRLFDHRYRSGFRRSSNLPLPSFLVHILGMDRLGQGKAEERQSDFAAEGCLDLAGTKCARTSGGSDRDREVGNRLHTRGARNQAVRDRAVLA